MAAGDATAADIPGRYDVVINGKGYQLLDTIEPSIPFRTQRAIYSYSPTFLERTNVSGSYGDNQQSFWLTIAQNDWSLGEEQRFFRIADETKKRRYYLGSSIDIGTEGQAKLFGAATTVSFASSVGVAISRYGTGNTLVVSTTHLYEVDGSGSITDQGAHGASISGVSVGAMAFDGINTFISGDTGNIIKWNGSTFASFSSTVASSLAFVNNTLFGVRNSTLSYYSTTGTASTAYTWKAADGTVAQYGLDVQIVPYGGQILALRPGVSVSPTEIWTADTTGATQVATFPVGFAGHGMCVAAGIVYIVGRFTKKNYGVRTEVWYYANGNIGKLWQSSFYNTGTVGRLAICEFDAGVAFTDSGGGRIVAYNLGTGGVSTIAAFSPGSLSARVWLAPNNSGLTLTNDTANATVLPQSSAATSGFIETSLFDFDSTLTKLFRGITVDFVSATDGNGGSVDIAYQIDSLDGAYTSLATGVTSGTENLLSSISGHAISVKVTLNKGTSTNGPLLKRIYVRAAPLLQTYQAREYVLDLSGIGFKSPVQLNDDSWHPLSGHEQAQNLFTAITSTSPFTIADRFGSFTGICEPDKCEIYETREGNDSTQFSGGFVAKITVRQI